MEATREHEPCRLGDRVTSDVRLCLLNNEGRSEFFYCHSSILTEKSKFFAEKLSSPVSTTCIEINCSKLDYDHHVKLLELLYSPCESHLGFYGSVKSALGILQVAIAFHCEEITHSCIQYLEAIPWDDKEEEEIMEAASKLGPVTMPILARIQPVDFTVTKSVFVSAFRFATSTGGPCPPFGEELKSSAQEQIEFMLREDEDTPLITVDDEVKSVVKKGLSFMFSSFESKLSSLLNESDLASDTAEVDILQGLSDLDWMSNILPKMELMKDFVSTWAETSENILGIVEDQKLKSVMWGLKLKLIEVCVKVLEAVGYGNVILPAVFRVQILKLWLPYIRKMKPLLDSKSDEEASFPYKMDEDLCQSIEGAIVSFILALPSNDQADILADWMKAEQAKFPDLTEAFEVWCYRTKSAKRRLTEAVDEGDNAPISL